MPRFLAKVLIILLLAVPAWCAANSPAAAGGGPENLFLVVNPKSPGSLAIANHYIQLRHVPAGNVFYLPWDPKAEEVNTDGLREEILKPIFEAIQSRRLSVQIDYIVYSSDFPWKVRYDSDFGKFIRSLAKQEEAAKPDKDGGESSLARLELSPVVKSNPWGSLNSFTYLWQSVMKADPDYLAQNANRYLRVFNHEKKDVSTLGFHSTWQFGSQGELVESGGKSYMLSTVLGVTAGRGNTVDEILRYLKRSAAADGTHPPGVIYFVKNDDIRSTVRHDMYPQAVKEIDKLGISAQIIKGTVPLNKNDVQGVVMGTSDFNWKASGSTILPGAICDNFTSYGGYMGIGGQQTPISEFMRYGAAGASGTVIEPFRILDKFPLPYLQVHYVRGCTLAEAFYQSVASPYQLMILGDPLCRPWARIPQVRVSGAKPNYIVKGTLTLTPAASVPYGGAVDHFELFVNGSRAALCRPGGTLTLDTTLLPDGYQELRVVAVEASPIQSQGRAFLPVITDNHGRKIAAKVAATGPVRPDKPLLIDVDSPGSIGVSILQNSRVVGRLAGEKGQIKIEAGELGAGPVRLQAIGLGQGGPTSHVLAMPIDVTVEMP
jgi:hypothetical protein